MRFLFCCLPLSIVSLSFLLISCTTVQGMEPLKYNDPKPQRYHMVYRASELDSEAKEHPEIDFVFEKDGKIQDYENAIVDTSVPSRGMLVIWLMSHNKGLFERLADYGCHAIQVHYANRWFSKVCRENPVGAMCRGNVRLEAATGIDASDQVSIPVPDSMKVRALRMVQQLAKDNPQANWGYYLNAAGDDLNWEKVCVSGSSHGSTTAARFALHQKVGRVVMLCGPRDQLQNWQKLPSATPRNRFFGFSHVLDGGWTADHYCRSWELLGLNEFGPIVNVDEQSAPYGNTRRLITDFDVQGNARRAHSSVQPGGNAWKDSNGNYMHEAVWKYLYTQPVVLTGDPTPLDPSCDKEQRD